MSNKELTPHPQADILRAIAQGKKMQRLRVATDEWEHSEFPLNDMVNGYELRIKPETMTLAGHEFPEPVREPLTLGQQYWIARIEGDTLVDTYRWAYHRLDECYLQRGLIQLTETGAIAQARAIIAACGGEV